MADHRSKNKREKSIRRAMGKYKSDRKNAHGSQRKNSRSSRSQPPTYESMKNPAVRYPEQIEGTFSYSGRGFGFCIPDPAYGMADVFIPPRKTMGAMTGDRVTVELYPREHSRDADRTFEGEVTSVEYSTDTIIGTLHTGQGYSYVLPDAKRFGVIIYVPEKDVDVSGAKDNDKVEVVPPGEEFFTRTKSITVRGPRDMPYFDTAGRISTVFGSSLSRDANYSAILYASGIRTEFPESVLRHADGVSKEPISAENRTDLRGKLIMTIDGAGAKDLDDAVSLERTEDGYLLGVHIADVSHYVRQKTPTEEEAAVRGTSVYFTDKVVPMLPEALSNDACSLNAGTDKYALSAEITLDKNGQRTGTRIFKSILRSSVRGVYSEVNDLFAQGESSAYYEKYREVYPMLTDMYALYEILQKNSEARGVMELEDAEAVIVLDENGNPADIVRRERGDGEKLIEQFMLQANMGVAQTLNELHLPCLYRIHEQPDREKIRAFAVFAHNVGLDTRGLTGDDLAAMPAHTLSDRLMAVLREAEERGIGAIVSSVLLRSMMKAKYVPQCLPHFGLGAEEYCHFTSPIRRYPDLFVHTVITETLEKTGLRELTAGTPFDEDPVPHLTRIADDRGVSSTDCEIRAMNAEREIEDLYMALYMADRIGEEFDVTVSSVTRSGMFVQCENLIEGFVPAACWPASKINEELMTLTAGTTVYTLGSPLRVRLSDVDISGGKITFEPVRAHPSSAGEKNGNTAENVVSATI
ncbi:MAG: VacB/RNase II family 3'-5' exoribonuclease [Clostridia bacterium]|nr:VacB/RNase II family 3'-5' exoribonuclease [Clostridia bacterium]